MNNDKKIMTYYSKLAMKRLSEVAKKYSYDDLMKLAEECKMSRLEDEYIMAVVRNRSGIDAGKIDYSLVMERFERLSLGCLQDVLVTLNVLKSKVSDRIQEMENKD